MSKTIKVTDEDNRTGEVLVAYELYEDSSGNGGTVTLSDSAANYKYLEIYYKDADGYYNMTKVYSPNNKYFICVSSYPNISGNLAVYSKYSIRYISDTSITHIKFAEWGSNGAVNYDNQFHYITKVVGYK